MPLVDSRVWRVYLLECGDGTYYCGRAVDVIRRFKVHQSGKGAKYTRGRGPLKLLAVSDGMRLSAADRLEHRIKSLPKKRKVGELLRNVTERRFLAPLYTT